MQDSNVVLMNTPVKFGSLNINKYGLNNQSTNFQEIAIYFGVYFTSSLYIYNFVTNAKRYISQRDDITKERALSFEQANKIFGILNNQKENKDKVLDFSKAQGIFNVIDGIKMKLKE